MNRTVMLGTVAVLLLTSVVERTLALPDGAPEGTCDDMMPFHDGAKQLNGSDSPYRLEQEKATFEPNETLSAGETLPHISFFLRHKVSDLEPIGAMEF
ncbi:hypothetical protein MTO96_035562 [Rhipicephalus appendiculatus]